MGECGSHVGKSFVVYPCTLEKGHDGPCMAQENAPSVRQRRIWEETQHPSQAATEATVLTIPPREIEVDLKVPLPNDTLHDARQALADALNQIDALMSARTEIGLLLDEIENGIPDSALEARSALSMIRAMLRA
jgi:hypothetical protein